MVEPDGYNAAVEGFREDEFPMLKDAVYLDHAGTTLYSRSLVERVAASMMTTLLGNPHSASSSPSSQTASLLIEDVRLRALQFLGADPAVFDLVFVANATAGVKLVAEAFRGSSGDTLSSGGISEGFSYLYHQACHTSLVGVREEAVSSVCCTTADIEACTAQPRDSEDMISSLLSRHGLVSKATDVLFAYPAQSNMDGSRYPPSWASRVREARAASARQTVYTLVDAAAMASTAPLDGFLADAARAPDFVVISFYKIFGWPDLGALLVRRPAESVFARRRYFGGGTVSVVAACSGSRDGGGEQWHVTKQESPLHERLEDGTLPVHSILALGAALDTHKRLFGSMARIAAHTSYLARRLRRGLALLRHGNGQSVCVLYGSAPLEHGLGSGTVAFNLRNAGGAWVSLAEFDKLAALCRFHVRTGSVCNPGGVAAALGLAPWELRQNFSAGLRCGADTNAVDSDIVAGKPTGVIRASLGAMSTTGDVDRFLDFVSEYYVDAAETEELQSLPPLPQLPPPSPLFVVALHIYPIKSCGAMAVPPHTSWEVRAEGLAWDREWCLVHRGSGRALSQKQHPQMVMLRPHLDFGRGVLQVEWAGGDEKERRQICVPLSSNPSMFAPLPSTSRSSGCPLSLSSCEPFPSRVSRVCGEEIAAQVYSSADVNDFFTQVLGVPCMLARFPPGGQGKSMRHAKAHLQKHQNQRRKQPLPSPPDSEESEESGRSDRSDRSDKLGRLGSLAAAKESPLTDGRILLSNESPILAIHMASVRALNAAMEARGSREAVPASVFRANIVLDSRDGGTDAATATAYGEDGWTRVHIGRQAFRMLGACRRCHMVCIDQQTGTRREEPFVTLAKTRRFDGKVFFGIHMAHDPDVSTPSHQMAPHQQHPTIGIGDAVRVEGGDRP